MIGEWSCKGISLGLVLGNLMQATKMPQMMNLGVNQSLRAKSMSAKLVPMNGSWSYPPISLPWSGIEDFKLFACTSIKIILKKVYVFLPH